MDIDLSGMGFENGAHGVVAGGHLVITRDGAVTDRLPVVVSGDTMYLRGHAPGDPSEMTCAHGNEQWQCGAHGAALPLRVREAGMDSPPLAHEAMRLTIGRREDGEGGEVFSVEAEVSHVSDDGLTTWKPCATEGGVRPCDLGTTVEGLFSRHALALLLAVGLVFGGPTFAGDLAWGEKDPVTACTAREKEAVCPDGFVAPKCQPAPEGCRCVCIHPDTGLTLPARL